MSAHNLIASVIIVHYFLYRAPLYKCIRIFFIM